ncbi:winged helix-turn-helix transcriptional regulator [Sphaerisporangium melleum]|uniref:winged helix-turn-helix transcriptional regulator n=1 Tax=Sphaerisporangium melleum TaxID=321316 RepID=UPI00166861F3|nr:helix-turn-helix domain-containing protein [Sphaerisporangium melleum]
MTRAYDDPCGLARALNLVGDRWALLIVRELLLGPKRFTQLRRGLPGASQSMLTARLAELEEAQVVRRRRLGPPASTWAYELTEWGRELQPALVPLARWGSRSPLTSSAELSVDALALALTTTFDPAAAGDLEVRCQLRLDGDTLLLTIYDGKMDVTRADASDADMVIETSAVGLRALTFGGASLDAVDATIQGDRETVARLLRLFKRPTPITTLD